MIYTIFFQQLLNAVLSLFVVFVIGKTIVSFFDVTGNRFLKLFVTYIVGLSAIVLFFSIIKAQGRTITILLIPIIGYVLIYYKDSFSKKPILHVKKSISDFLISLIPFLSVFLYQSLSFYNFKQNNINYLWNDYYAYGLFSDALKTFGTESALSSELQFFFHNLKFQLIPYHYPELWLTAFFSSLLRISTLLSYSFIVYPLLVSVFLMGIISLFEDKIKNRIVIISISFVLLFLTGILLPYFRFIGNTPWSIMDTLGQKLAFIYCILLLCFILLKNYKIHLGLIVLLSVPIFSVTLLPSIYGGVFLYSIYLLLTEKSKSQNRHNFTIITFTFCLLLLYALFYFVFKSNYSNNFGLGQLFKTGIFKGMSDIGFTFKNCKILVSNFVVYSIPTILIHIGIRFYLYILFFLVLINYLVKRINLFVLIFLVLLVGATVTTIMSSLTDSGQFIELCSSFLVVYIIILISDCLLDFRTSSNKFTLVQFCLVIIIVLVNIPKVIAEKQTYSNSNSLQFLKSIDKNITEDTAVVLLFISEKDVSFTYSFHYLWLERFDLSQLSLVSNKTIIFPLANSEISLKSKKMSSRDSNDFLNFTPVNVWKKSGKSQNLLSFINHYNIKYFYFRPGAEIPDFIKNRTLVSLESTSSHSRFIKIK